MHNLIFKMMKQKIQTLLNQMNHDLVEREEAIKTALLTVLAGENLVLIGPPGTGKSMIARRIAESLETQNAGYFEYLLTKFSTPEEIFGPLSITELKADRFKRNTSGYLPSVQIAFLDEIFKASSSILNSLLTILNERVFHNGSEPQKVPLLSLISASNELPTGEEELNALYDRFLVRTFVDYVREENLHKLFETTTTAPSIQKLTQHDLLKAQQAAEKVTVSSDIVEAIRSIWKQHKTTFKEDRRENLSDRRLKKIIYLLRVSAATNERQTVDLSDVMLLKNCLWNHIDNAEKVREIIIKTLQKYSRAVPIHGKPVKESVIKNPSSHRTEGKIKGFVGNGTENDPILIQTLEDFLDISRPDVGLNGYYFKQTADIDCASLTHWTPMIFQGHYDGDDKSIKNVLNSNYLFSTIQENSKIINLNLENCTLAENITKSEIVYCNASGRLVKTAIDSTISKCKVGWQLVSEAENCQIADCISVINKYGGTFLFGGIATSPRKGTIERCFVTGIINEKYDSKVGGIVGNNDSQTAILKNAIGIMDVRIKDVSNFKRIFTNYDAKKENNVAIDSITVNGNKYQGKDDPNGQDGKTIAAAMFTQRYFELTLGWDFEKVWEWDAKENRPTLQALKNKSKSTISNSAKTSDMEDLLVQQMRANIWL